MNAGDIIKKNESRDSSFPGREQESENVDMADGKYSAPALEKGMDIIEVLSEQSHGLTLNELARALGRNANQIYRMVFVLHQRGYIRADKNDRYSLTLKLFRVVHRQPPLKRLIALAQPLLVELAQRTRQSCHLSLHQQGRVVVVVQADSPERWSFGLKVGAVMGLTDTSSGHVLLAYQDEVNRSRMLNNHAKVDGELQMDPGHLLALLAEVRKQGCAVMPSVQIRGVTNIAFPVWGAGNQVIAAVNVPYIERIDQAPGPSVTQVQQIQHEICRRLSDALGADAESLQAMAD